LCSSTYDIVNIGKLMISVLPMVTLSFRSKYIRLPLIRRTSEEC
jgi:hypothetical protein